jgi:vacuolar-type H+-ATPase subunit H
MEKKIDITEILATINEQITAVNHAIKDIIQGEGLNDEQINSWITSFNQIIRAADHTTEILEESKND